ncbi:hypothetical protein [Fibrella aestuarina]|uniref:hypothetical protein n=1 Tax=Fibrella aestuarina TaxID=651143 RepID=UPI00059DD814|nr:hypothetical protein [Fibrella aestuarina]
MSEQDLINKINQANENIERLNSQHKANMAPFKNEVAELTREYSQAYSPLKVGTVIEHKPYGAKHTGIVKILSATCLVIPDRWSYEAQILSVGDNAGESDKKLIGRNTIVLLNRSETPKIITEISA